MSSAKRLALQWHDRFTRWRLRRALSPSDSSRPRPSYAGRLPRPAAKASGGAVKLMRLAEAFPEAGRAANLLYLVSSALPSSALAWAETAKERGLKIVLNQNGVAYPAWAGPESLGRINDRNRRLAELADHVIFQSEFCRTAFAKWVAPPPARSSLAYNPVDLKEFPFVQGADRPTDVLLMGSVAQPERLRIPLVAASLARRRGRPWRVAIAGKLNWPGAERDLAAWLDELDLHSEVSWRGAYRQEQAAFYYGNAKVLVHLQDKDASPTVPLEALSSGTPVVGIRSGGMPELIPAEAGCLLAVPEDWESFHYPEAEAVVDAVETCRNSREQMGRAGRDWVERKFGAEAFVKAHGEIFRGVLA